MASLFITDFVRDAFCISGYIFLYLIATLAAGGVGRLAVHIAKRWIFERFIPERMKMHRDLLEVSTWVSMLTCATGFAIAAVGQLVKHLVRGLPTWDDVILIQIAKAFLGLLIFVTFCLGALLVAVSSVAVWTRCIRQWRSRTVDEESGLLEDIDDRSYGTPDNTDDDDSEEPSSTQSAPEGYNASIAPPTMVDGAWIQMQVLSSVRRMDLRRMRSCV